MRLAWFGAAVAEPWIYVAAIGYLVTFFAWMALIERVPLGTAFAASHAQVVTVLVASVVLFHERLSAREVCGAVCIIAGIVVLAITEGRSPVPSEERG